MEGKVSATGVVKALEPEKMVVRVRLDGGGDDCGSACDACNLCDKKRIRHIDVAVPLADGQIVHHRRGERVRLEYERHDPALAAVLFFGPALAGLIAGGIIGWLWRGADSAFLAGAFVGFVAGLATTLALKRLFPGMIQPEGRLTGSEYGQREV